MLRIREDFIKLNSNILLDNLLSVGIDEKRSTASKPWTFVVVYMIYMLCMLRGDTH